MLEYYMRYYNASANRAPRRATTHVNQPQQQPQRVQRHPERTQRQQPQLQQNQQPTSLSHHRRRCTVCRHPESAAIEEQFLDWGNPRDIAAQYGLHYSAIYRHVRASGLHNHRVGNHVRVLERIFERAGEATITSHALVQAVRAYDRILERYKRDLFTESLKERVRSAQQLLLADQRAEQAAYPTVDSYYAAAAAATSGLPGTLDYLKIAPASGPASAPGLGECP